MFGKKNTFGKLGNRSAARFDITIEGGLSTTAQSLSCRVENISATGCCLDMSECRAPTALREGYHVMVKVERAEALGHVAWADGARCGVTFADPLTPKQLERLQWIVEHPERHQQNVATSAAANWR